MQRNPLQVQRAAKCYRTDDVLQSGLHAAAGVTTTWKIVVTYLASALLMLAFGGLQKIKKIEPPEAEDYREKQAIIASAKAPEAPEKSLDAVGVEA